LAFEGVNEIQSNGCISVLLVSGLRLFIDILVGSLNHERIDSEILRNYETI